MGYETEFALKIQSDVNAILVGDIPVLQAITEYIADEENDLTYCLANFNDSDAYDFCSSTSCKWYSHEDDIKKMSLKFRDVLFDLSGKGEDEDDYWKKYFLNGKMQQCYAEVIISYPEFDMEKLR